MTATRAAMGMRATTRTDEQVMQELRLNAKRIDARLSDPQEARLRRHFMNKQVPGEAHRAGCAPARPGIVGCGAGTSRVSSDVSVS